MPNQLSSKYGPTPLPRHSFSIGDFAVDHPPASDLLPSAIFMKMLCLERKRAERSGRRLVLMLLESPTLLKYGSDTVVARGIQSALSRATRETDIRGWHLEGAIIAVIFTEIPVTETSVVPVLSTRVNRALRDELSVEQALQVALSFHVFPEESGSIDPGLEASAALYPDLLGEIESKRLPFLIKRVIDIAGSVAALILLAPLFALISVFVKLTSPGPVFFRQQRLGQYGKSFTFLKFRSMHAKTDHAVHEAYMKRFISNQTDSADGGDGQVYKLKADSRVTPVGRFLRRSSLDELPQFLNVLAGQMSLVGPRPPLPYEVTSYEAWHRRRLIAKPGITGFWQVEGRSRVKFDEMVRMDLDYARSWSLWRDIKILLQTPGAVLGGNGAH